MAAKLAMSLLCAISVSVVLHTTLVGGHVVHHARRGEITDTLAPQTVVGTAHITSSAPLVATPAPTYVPPFGQCGGGTTYTGPSQCLPWRVHLRAMPRLQLLPMPNWILPDHDNRQHSLPLVRLPPVPPSHYKYPGDHLHSCASQKLPNVFVPWMRRWIQASHHSYKPRPLSNLHLRPNVADYDCDPDCDHNTSPEQLPNVLVPWVRWWIQASHHSNESCALSDLHLCADGACYDTSSQSNHDAAPTVQLHHLYMPCVRLGISTGHYSNESCALSDLHLCADVAYYDRDPNCDHHSTPKQLPNIFVPWVRRWIQARHHSNESCDVSNLHLCANIAYHDASS
ncbi:hypothetical protein FA15DRAFT_760809 [Coprinopsis marcescibilis]|uniref:CBM1 domain-containing protein n=1 Tax=Coprinopsis marcescibilis TaxID=230819 RepID=A0A5C3KDV5_COPMA|nr:hypothetical protein FA15DRAFT_760809 [Coprinopsis marcescibilis]